MGRLRLGPPAAGLFSVFVVACVRTAPTPPAPAESDAARGAEPLVSPSVVSVGADEWNPCLPESTLPLAEWARCRGVPAASAVLAWDRPGLSIEPGEAGDMASAAWSDGRVLVFYETGTTFTAIRVADGENVWRIQLPPPWRYFPCRLTPTVVGGFVFASLADIVTAIDLATGRIVWSTSVEGVACGRVLGVGTEVLIPVRFGLGEEAERPVPPTAAVFALAAASGDEVWRLALGQVDRLDIQQLGESLVVASSACATAPSCASDGGIRVASYSLASRTKTAEVALPAASPSFAAVHGQTVVVADDRAWWEGKWPALTALRLPDLTQVWQAKLACGSPLARQSGPSLYLSAGSRLSRVLIETGALESEGRVGPPLAGLELGGVAVVVDGLVSSVSEGVDSLWLVRASPDGGSLQLLRIGEESLVGRQTELVTASDAVAVVATRSRMSGLRLDADAAWPATQPGESEAAGRPEDERVLVAPPELEEECGFASPNREQLAHAKAAIRRVARSPDASAVATLARIAFEAEPAWPEELRLEALAGLGRRGSSPARAAVEQRRRTRSGERVAWRPPARPLVSGGRRNDCGANATRCFVVANAFTEPVPADGADAGGERTRPAEACYGREETFGSAFLDLVSPDGSLRSFIGYAAGGVADLWLQRRGTDDEAVVFGGVTSPGVLGIRAVDATPGGVTIGLRRVERLPPTDPAAGGPEPRIRDVELSLRWDELERDADGDGWSDLLERRLRTNPEIRDTDGDGLIDSEDPSPRGAPPAPEPCGRPQILAAAFDALYLTADGRVPVFVVGDESVNLQYEGSAGPVIYLSPEEAGALIAEVGQDGATYVYFDRPARCADSWSSGDDPPGPFVVAPDGTEASVRVTQHRGSLNALYWEILVRCIDGVWFPIGTQLTGVS